MASRYWVGGTASWDATAGSKWSLTSGGAGGEAVPTSSDDVFFDAASGAVTVTISATANCNNITCTGYTGTLTNNSTLNIYGNMTLVSGMTFTQTGFLVFKATSSGKTITSAGKNLSATTFNGSGGDWTLQDNTTIAADVLAGTLDTNNKNITGQVTATAGTVNFGTSTVTSTSASPLSVVNGTISASQATFVVNITSGSGTTSFSTGGYAIGTLNLQSTSKVPMLAGTVGGVITNLIMAAGTSLQVYVLAVGYSVNTLSATGTASSRISLASSSAGTQGTLSIGGGSDLEADYMTIQDIYIHDPHFLFADNSIDGGNNHNVIFNSLDTFLAVSSKRNVAANLLVSWKKDFRAAITFFTIGVSTIGGNDPIKSEGGIPSDWNKYLYFDESDYLLSLDWERQLNMPIGGVSKALADGRLSNTTNRFLPEYVGGNSELFTAILPRRPFIINAGFEYNNVPQLIPEFVGIFTKQPLVNLRDSYLDFHGADFIDFLQNRKIDNTVMFTGVRSDEIIERFLTDMGFATAQYELDYGINNIPFAIFERGQRFSDAVNDLVQAENGHFYQDAEGRLRFENRQHWDSSPHNTVSYVISTAQVIDAEAPDEDHIINVVEVKAKVRNKQPEQTIFKLVVTDAIEIPAGGTKELFVDFEDPVLAVTTPTSTGTLSYFKANTLSDGTGTDVSSSVSITYAVKFAKSAKFIFTNSTGAVAYLTELVVSGRPSKIEREIYIRDKDDSSVTAYEERPYVIENDYIQSEDWGRSFAQMILQDYAEPEKLQRITIRAIPELELGDLVSWQGRYWRVFNIRNTLNPSVGFTQELLLLQRTIQAYFRIGISTIGSTDRIAP